VSFILVRPVFLGNIGAIARVMKNFGLANLRLVQPPRNYKDSEARRMSVGAFDLLKEAQVFSTLNDALTDICLAVGTTSGQQREITPLPLETMSAQIVATASSNRVAVVLGDERDGLSRAELERCHSVIRVSTVPDFPALNVAQTAAIVAYELIRVANQASYGPDQARYSCGKEDDKLFAMIERLLEEVGFSRKFNRDTVLRELRGFYQRARPTTREADLLNGALHRINQKLSDP
jgi:TrmH family RNA methyltransferase